MLKAQEFLVTHIKKLGDSYETVEDKSGISKATISRMMSGQTVGAASMRAIATAYDVLDEFLALVSAAADPKRAADDLHEMYRHSESLIVENCEARIMHMKQRMDTMEAVHAKEIEHITNAHDKVVAMHEANTASLHKRTNILVISLIAVMVICFLMMILLAYYIHLDLTNLNIGLYRGSLTDSGAELFNVLTTALHTHVKGTIVPVSILL